MAGEIPTEIVKSSIYIPICDRVDCNQWLQKVVYGLKENHVEFQIGHSINGSYKTWFKRFFEKFDFTIIHYCPFLWKRICSLKEYFQDKDAKLILVRFEDGVRSIDINNYDTLDDFFQEMDSVQQVSDDNDLRKFVKDIMFETSPLPTHKCIDNDDATEIESISSDASEIKSFSSYGLPSHKDSDFTNLNEFTRINKQDELSLSEDLTADSKKFEKYYDIFGSVDDTTAVFVRSCDVRWICPKDFENVGIKLIGQINGFKQDDLQDINYVLHRLLPMLYHEKRMLDVSFITTCKWKVLRERALILLEFLLWECAADTKSQVKDVMILVNMDESLSHAMQKLRDESEKMTKQDILLFEEHITHVSLMLLSNIIMISGTSRDAASKADSYLSDKYHLFEPTDTSQNDLKIFLNDGKKCSQAEDIVRRYLQKLLKQIKLQEEPETEFTAKTLLKESLCVQIIVIFELLKKVFCLNKDPLSFLEDYLNQTGKIKLSFKKRRQPSLICVSVIFRGLTMFLSHTICKKEHMDVKEICGLAMNVLKLAADKDLKEEMKSSLLPLLFDTNDAIRLGMRRIFGLEVETAKKHKQPKEISLIYGINAVMQMLLPFVKEVTEISLHVASNGEKKKSDKGKASALPPMWNEFQLKYADRPAQMFIYTMCGEDHNEHNKTNLKFQKDLHYTEILNLKELKHGNVIEMFAYQVDKMPQFYILEDGQQRLQVALKNARDNKKFLEQKLLYKLLLDALSGLRYCHDSGYIHRNLTAFSLCVFNMQHVKLCDFGLCMSLTDVELVCERNSQVIPLHWSAPESVKSGEFSKRSDIWMVGHLIYEVMTHGILPYSFLISDDLFVTNLKENSLTLQKEPCLNDKTFELITKCNEYQKEFRPSIEEVFTSLEEISITECPGAKVIFPSIDGENAKSSIQHTRGIPKEHCQKNIMESKWHLEGLKVINMSNSMKQTILSESMIFEEKLVHPMSKEICARIHSKEFKDILPHIKLFKNSDEENQIKCKIPSSSTSLYQMTMEKRLGPDLTTYLNLIYQVAETLFQMLTCHKLIIGDLSPQFVFIDGSTLKPYIISFSFLKFIGFHDPRDSESESELELEKIPPDRRSSAAPEVISNGQFSPASDVFCFGNFVWVLLTAFYKNSESSDGWKDKDIAPFSSLKEREHRQALNTHKWEKHNPQPAHCPDELYTLILQCVRVNQKERPSLQQVCKHLKSFIDKAE